MTDPLLNSWRISLFGCKFCVYFSMTAAIARVVEFIDLEYSIMMLILTLQRVISILR